ncbi:MAG: alkaline phosphatase family protein [Bryobacteraceae bacterium]
MKHSLSFLFAMFLAAGAMAAEPQRGRMVVVISLDGFPSYALKDPRLPIPTIRRLMEEGATATSMRPPNPTVTWPSHTTMVTGVDASRHQLLYNGLLTPPANGRPGKIEPWRDKDDMVHSPTVYDVAYKAGLTTAQVDWVAIYGARTITWQFPEIPNPDGPVEKELIARGTVSREDVAKFREGGITWRDRIWTEAAIHILTTHKPNLMLYHLLNMDSTHHKYGPMSLASYNAFGFADDRVKEIYDALQRAGLLDRTTLLVVSDHGFRNVDRVIRANVVLDSKGVTGAWVVPEGGTAMVYATNPAQRDELVPQVENAFKNAEGIEGIYRRSEFGKLGLPTSGSQSPDLVLAAKPGYAFGGGSGPAVYEFKNGSHGYVNTDPEMQCIFLAWGNGIRAGARMGDISVADVAPTIATLLGIEMNGVQGRVLREILQ